MFLIAKYHDVLRRLELDSIEGVKKFQGELIKNHKGRRDIQRVEVGAPSGLVFYLKRNWKPYRKDGLKSLLSHGEVWSQSRTEWENSMALQRAGICVAEPIAFGEECGLAWEKFSFILTGAARGTATIEQFLESCRDSAERLTVIQSLAGEIRKMHDAGLASPDLFTRHIFLEQKSRFCLIDMARLDRRRRLPDRLRARDLAALNVTAPLRYVRARERARFASAYGVNRLLRTLIRQRSAHLLRRRKFQDFSTIR